MFVESQEGWCWYSLVDQSVFFLKKIDNFGYFVLVVGVDLFHSVPSMRLFRSWSSCSMNIFVGITGWWRWLPVLSRAPLEVVMRNIPETQSSVVTLGRGNPVSRWQHIKLSNFWYLRLISNQFLYWTALEISNYIIFSILY